MCKESVTLLLFISFGFLVSLLQLNRLETIQEFSTNNNKKLAFPQENKNKLVSQVRKKSSQ